MHFHHMRKNSYDKILKRESKEQYLSTVPKFCYIYKYVIGNVYASK